MAKRSLSINNLNNEIDIILGDIKEASKIFGLASFDVVTSNPPYMTVDHGLVNPDKNKAIARHEILCTLEDLIRETSKVLKHNGRFYMVHRPFRLVEILNTLSYFVRSKKDAMYILILIVNLICFNRMFKLSLE